MGSEDDLLRQRYERIEQIRELGFEPYGASYATSSTVEKAVADWRTSTAEDLSSKPRLRIAGRIQSIRRMGKKAGFLHLAGGGEKLQVYVRQDGMDERSFRLVDLLDIGDIVGVDGYLFRTRTDELSVHAETLTFLSKILLPLPEKWHGLDDVEIRYRQRYLDLIANPEVRNVFITRSKLVRSIRRQLDAAGFLEVETPMMQPLYGGAAARPFVTHHNALDLSLYLRIAPELYLKRLVVGGLDRVYEINRNFRNEGISIRHNPEFTMLEMYEAYSDMRGMMTRTRELLRQAAVDTTGSEKVKFNEQVLDFTSFRELSLREAIIDFWPDHDARPSLANVSDPEWLARQSSQKSAGLALMDLFERVAEPHLQQPTFVYDFPLEVSPLSKQKLADPDFVDRFELYIAGMELANAFSELNDPQEQRRRFQAQLDLKAQGDDEAHLMDADYVRALCYGMPPAGGEGIGIDRLTMILTGSRSLRDVILFPLLRPEPNLDIVKRLEELDDSPFPSSN